MYNSDPKHEGALPDPDLPVTPAGGLPQRTILPADLSTLDTPSGLANALLSNEWPGIEKNLIKFIRENDSEEASISVSLLTRSLITIMTTPEFAPAALNVEGEGVNLFQERRKSLLETLLETAEDKTISVEPGPDQIIPFSEYLLNGVEKYCNIYKFESSAEDKALAAAHLSMVTDVLALEEQNLFSLPESYKIRIGRAAIDLLSDLHRSLTVEKLVLLLDDDSYALDPAFEASQIAALLPELTEAEELAHVANLLFESIALVEGYEVFEEDDDDGLFSSEEEDDYPFLPGDSEDISPEGVDAYMESLGNETQEEELEELTEAELHQAWALYETYLSVTDALIETDDGEEQLKVFERALDHMLPPSPVFYQAFYGSMRHGAEFVILALPDLIDAMGENEDGQCFGVAFDYLALPGGKEEFLEALQDLDEADQIHILDQMQAVVEGTHHLCQRLDDEAFDALGWILKHY